MIRISGEIEPVPHEEMTRDVVEMLLYEIMDEDVRARYDRDKDVDFAYESRRGPGALHVYEQYLGMAARSACSRAASRRSSSSAPDVCGGSRRCSAGS